MTDEFAKLCFAYQMADDQDDGEGSVARAKAAYDAAYPAFKEALAVAGFTGYSRIGFDDYDCSIEFYDVDNDARLSASAQEVVFKAGFVKAYVNHQDIWQTHYSWNWREPFTPARGWRRRWVDDPQSKNTRGAGENGYFEISYWPQGWGEGTENWINDGYMRIVPDPLETPIPALPALPPESTGEADVNPK